MPDKITDAADLSLVNFVDPDKAECLRWIAYYLVQEDFSITHLKALRRIVSLFNESRESEEEIFQFSLQLGLKHRNNRKAPQSL